MRLARSRAGRCDALSRTFAARLFGDGTRTTRHMLAALVVSTASFGTAHADVAVTACGTVVAPGEVGVLQGDLDCSAAPASQAAVALGNHATLDLGGFTVTGAVDGTGVRCPRHCTVQGPGTITSAPPGPGHLHAACIRAVPDPDAPRRSQRVTVEDLVLTGCGFGVVGPTERPGLRLTVKGVAADGNGASFVAGDIQALDVSATNGAGAGFFAPTGKVVAVDVHADDNDPTGIEAARVSLTNGTASGNAAFGVEAVKGPAKLAGATVTGNGIRDVVSAKRPKVSGSTCGTSAHWIAPNGIGAPWDVCSDD